MLIERFAPHPDAIERHHLHIDAPKELVYAALWRTDFGASIVTKTLMRLRSLPSLLLRTGHAPTPPRVLDLEAMMGTAFGKLDEKPGEEIVLGVSGRFWRPTGNLLPFHRSDFDGPVASGTARGVWNFHVSGEDGGTRLFTETRVVCGDPASRRKFLAYWMVIRPFSGWIRLVMLRAVAAECASMRKRGPHAGG
jgi:hypothetical protein